MWGRVLVRLLGLVRVLMGMAGEGAVHLHFLFLVWRCFLCFFVSPVGGGRVGCGKGRGPGVGGAVFAAHRASHKDVLSSRHACEALAYCSGGDANEIRESKTRGGVQQWDAFAPHYRFVALAYCFGGAPTITGDSNTRRSMWALSFIWGTSEPYNHRAEAVTSRTHQRCTRHCGSLHGCGPVALLAYTNC